mmetsp:Transcript_26396/g.66590  ORF Transcript_26396/g.66590 Transcript_26396/m.66590 type:complete len:329 (-) Transcript_26396:3056-4042(-)
MMMSARWRSPAVRSFKGFTLRSTSTFSFSFGRNFTTSRSHWSIKCVGTSTSVALLGKKLSCSRSCASCSLMRSRCLLPLLMSSRSCSRTLCRCAFPAPSPSPTSSPGWSAAVELALFFIFAADDDEDVDTIFRDLVSAPPACSTSPSPLRPLFISATAFAFALAFALAAMALETADLLSFVGGRPIFIFGDVAPSLLRSRRSTSCCPSSKSLRSCSRPSGNLDGGFSGIEKLSSFPCRAASSYGNTISLSFPSSASTMAVFPAPTGFARMPPRLRNFAFSRRCASQSTRSCVTNRPHRKRWKYAVKGSQLSSRSRIHVSAASWSPRIG